MIQMFLVLALSIFSFGKSNEKYPDVLPDPPLQDSASVNTDQRIPTGQPVKMSAHEGCLDCDHDHALAHIQTINEYPTGNLPNVLEEGEGIKPATTKEDGSTN